MAATRNYVDNYKSIRNLIIAAGNSCLTWGRVLGLVDLFPMLVFAVMLGVSNCSAVDNSVVCCRVGSGASCVGVGADGS